MSTQLWLCEISMISQSAGYAITTLLLPLCSAYFGTVMDDIISFRREITMVASSQHRSLLFRSVSGLDWYPKSDCWNMICGLAFAQYTWLFLLQDRRFFSYTLPTSIVTPRSCLSSSTMLVFSLRYLPFALLAALILLLIWNYSSPNISWREIQERASNFERSMISSSTAIFKRNSKPLESIYSQVMVVASQSQKSVVFLANSEALDVWIRGLNAAPVRIR